ncbi:hypothetical protein [Aureivirga marina]|uniref:hypothetical protein n=1 Tax=Aureivirga marina TaxID=1182451 RepID=UPI0018CA832E|nr:hypothetical protein [Aureivirga marina]
MKKELTKEQIDVLYEFVEKQGKVPYFDVQIEIVDHLANDIEMQLEEDENMDFNKAFRNAFKKFGLSGFQKLIDENQRRLQKEYGKLLWKWFLKYFTFPRIMKSLFIFVFIFSLLFHFKETFDLQMINIVFLVFFGVMFLIKIIRDKFQFQKSKKWLLKEVLKGNNQYTSFTLNMIYMFTIFTEVSEFKNLFQVFIVSLIYTISFILFDIIFREIPKHSNKLLKERYLNIIS